MGVQEGANKRPVSSEVQRPSTPNSSHDSPQALQTPVKIPEVPKQDAKSRLQNMFANGTKPLEPGKPEANVNTGTKRPRPNSTVDKAECETAEKAEKKQKGYTPSKLIEPAKSQAMQYDAEKKSAIAKLALCTEETQICFVPNGKNESNYAKSYQRYEKYAHATTLIEALNCGAKNSDLLFDFQKGFLKLGAGPFRERPMLSKEDAKTRVDMMIFRWCKPSRTDVLESHAET